MAGFDHMTGEDPEATTIMMFDHILRQEGEVDVFGVRRWAGDSDSSDEGVNHNDDDDDGDYDIRDI